MGHPIYIYFVLIWSKLNFIKLQTKDWIRWRSCVKSCLQNLKY